MVSKFCIHETNKQHVCKYSRTYSTMFKFSNCAIFYVIKCITQKSQIAFYISNIFCLVHGTRKFNFKQFRFFIQFQVAQYSSRCAEFSICYDIFSLFEGIIYEMNSGWQKPATKICRRKEKCIQKGCEQENGIWASIQATTNYPIYVYVIKNINRCPKH